MFTLISTILLCVLFQNQVTNVNAVITNSTTYTAFTDEKPMPYAVSDMTATILPESIFADNGGPRVYLVGGCISDQICHSPTYCACTEITNKCIYYTPQSNQWHTCAPMPFQRYRHMAAQLGNDIYVFGGRNLSDTILDSVDKYDPVLNVWTPVFTTTNSLITSDAVAFSVGTDLYQVGGYDAFYNSLTSVVIFDTVAKTTSMGSSLAVGRGDTQIAHYEGEYYVLGGFNDVVGFCAPVPTVESYSPVSGNWTTRPNMLYGRGDMAAGVMGGFLFAIAGETKDSACNYSVPVKSVTRYSGASKVWAIEQNLTSSNFRFIAASYNNTVTGDYAIFLFGGQGVYDSVNKKYPILSTTVRYVPYSVRSSKNSPALSPGGIAGVVIAGIVVAACVVFAILSYVAYQKRDYFLMSDDQMSNKNNSSFDDTGSGQPTVPSVYSHSTSV